MKSIPQREFRELVNKMCTDRKVRIAVTRKSHEWFFTVYLGHYVQKPSAPFHEELFNLTNDDDWKLLCVVAFRGSGKSTIFTMSYALWSILGMQQKKFVLIFCQTRGQAKQHMMNLRRELENNALLKSDLGPFREEEDGDKEWSSSSLVFSRTNARITVASTEQAIRGLRNQEYRPDLVICDDVEDLASTKTQEGRDKTYQWFTSEVLPIGDTTTRIVVVGNLLHEDSLLMRLKSGIETKQREGIFREYPLLDAEETVLWPGKYPTPASIEEQKRAIGNESAWQREYLLRIVTDEDQVVSPEWIKYYDYLPDDGSNSDFRFAATGVDLAISEKETADYTAMVSAKIFGRGSDLRIYILPNPVNERLDFPKTVERAKSVSRAIGNGMYTKLFIEDTGYQKSLIDQLKNQNVPAEEFKTMGQDKRARLTLTTNLIQSGKVLFPQQGSDLLVRQLTGFGKERHDDLADAFSIIILKAMNADTAQFFPEFNRALHVIEPREIPYKWWRYRSVMPNGRNGTTCCLWLALGSDSILYVYKEYYRSGLDADQHARNIAKLSENADEVPEDYRWTAMDHTAFGPPSFAKRVVDIYEQLGVHGCISASETRLTGLDLIHQRLRGEYNKPPTIKILSSCTNLIRTLPLVVPDGKNSQDIEQTGETAAVDALRNFTQVLWDEHAPKQETAVQKRMRELGCAVVNIDPDDL